MAILEIALAVLAIILVWWPHRRPPNFPAGPMGVPFFGFLPIMFQKQLLHIEIAKLRLKYVSIMALPMGLKGYGLVLNDWKSMKEAIVNQPEIFAKRPVTFIINQVFPHGILGADGQLWKDKRRFSLHHLREFGFGKNSMESIVMEEVEKVLAFFESTKNCKIDTEASDFLFLPILNIIWGITAGKQYAMDNVKMQRFSMSLQTLLQDMQDLTILNVFPILRFFPNIWTRYSRMLRIQAEIASFLREEFVEHTKTYKEGEARDFIDAYLSEIYEQKKSDQPNPAFEDKQLLGIIFDLFGAGVETIKNTLMWSFLYMATWPEIQKKVQDELDLVIGRERLPQYSDRPHLPYTEAVLLEIQRYATIVPFSVPHATKKATTLMGYTIPKDTFVLQNLWSVHNDKDYWGDPELFRPERFLKTDGKVERPEYLIPFSAGPRSCLGEPLARMELFLFFTTILQRYFLCLATGTPHPSLKPIPSITLRPHSYSLSVQKRF